MASESSFDIVSKVDKQEVSNASLCLVALPASASALPGAQISAKKSKLVKRGISLKSLDSGKPYASGKETRIECSIKEGIAQDQAKKISKMIREEGPKGVKANIQGDELRVSSKSRDDLQEVIAMLKSADLEVDLQFVNYR